MFGHKQTIDDKLAYPADITKMMEKKKADGNMFHHVTCMVIWNHTLSYPGTTSHPNKKCRLFLISNFLYGTFKRVRSVQDSVWNVQESSQCSGQCMERSREFAVFRTITLECSRRYKRHCQHHSFVHRHKSAISSRFTSNSQLRQSHSPLSCFHFHY